MSRRFGNNSQPPIRHIVNSSYIGYSMVSTSHSNFCTLTDIYTAGAACVMPNRSIEENPEKFSRKPDSKNIKMIANCTVPIATYTFPVANCTLPTANFQLGTRHLPCNTRHYLI
jgi:hypothetical protein